MGTINSGNTIQFKSSEELFATLRADLESLDATGVINNQKLYRHIKFILERLGIAVHEEFNSIIDIESYVGKIPANFSILHAGYRIYPQDNPKRVQKFTNPMSQLTVYEETAISDIEPLYNLDIPAVFDRTSKITVKQVIKDVQYLSTWGNPELMKLSTRTERGVYSNDCPNVGYNSASEFALDVTQGKLYTNFQNDTILLQYYGLPIDEFMLPKVPANEVLFEAVYTYLRFKIFEDLFYNRTVQDIENRYQKAEIDYNRAFKEALFYVKLPSFQTLVQSIRSNRNKFAVYQQL